MAKKTNKTSHVMDLLTNGASPETEADEAMDEVSADRQEKKSDVQSHTVTPSKVTVVDEGSRNDRLSQEILDQLTQELEDETAQNAAAAPEDEAAPLDPAADEAQDEASQAGDEAAPLDPVAGQEDAEDEDTAPQAETGSAASQAETGSSVPQAKGRPQDGRDEGHPVIPESQLANHTRDKEYQFVNIMEQLLLRQDLDAVLKSHNVCSCPRCTSDVCALTLTGLPSKYVVTNRDSISPLISYYENKYKIPLLTEFMKACNRVRENPRHKRLDETSCIRIN